MLFPCQKGGESKLQLSGSKYVTMLFGNLPPQTYLLKALRDNRNMSSLKLIQRMMVEQFELKLEDLSPDAQLESLGLVSYQ